MKAWIKPLLLTLIPLVILLILFQVNVWYGFIGVAALLSYSAYTLRPTVYSMQANARYAKKDWTGAAERFDKANRISRKPGFAVSKAFILLKDGRPEEARELLERTMQLPLTRGEEMNAKINYANALWMLGEQDQAIDIMESVQTEYKNTIVLGNLGLFYVLQGDLTKALAFNQDAYEYNDNDKTILDNLGLTYYLLGRYEEAHSIYEKLMALTPTFMEAYYYHAQTLKALGDLDKAKSVMEKGLQYEPSMVTTVTRGMLEDTLKERTEAQA
jgi:tetratricopeptide (TPR) repeat protein